MKQTDVSKKSGRETLYVNTGYENEVTFGGSMDDDIDSFGDLTWREFIEEIRFENLPETKDHLDEWLEEEYGISTSQLDDKLDTESVDKYYDDLSFHQNNSSGNNVDAFDFLRSLDLFPMDKDGNGSSHGVKLDQSTSHTPRKTAWIADQVAADWLIEQALKRGFLVEIMFI